MAKYYNFLPKWQNFAKSGNTASKRKNYSLEGK